MANSLYALILAGGSGERFWPLSRRTRPKQLLRLVSERTLLEETVSRLEGLVPPERILILTNVEQEKSVRDLLKNFPKENIVAEPAKRDTAAAVALGAGWVAARDHAATMLALPADHVISRSRCLSRNDENSGGGGRRDRRAGDDRHQTDLGLSGFRLHRTRRAGKVAKHRENRGSSRRSFSRKAKCRSGRIVFAKRKLSLERGNVCVVGARRS